MPPSKTRIFKVCIVLFKSLRNSKRHNKGNFTLKFNSNKIMLYGQHYLVLNKISMKYFFYVSLQFLSELNNIFDVKDLKRFTFCGKLIYDMRPKRKNIESLDLIQKVILLRL